MDLNVHSEFLLNYLALAPLPLAIERVLECRIYSHLPFRKPILDAGCGDGVFAKILFNGKVCTGIDPNKKELQRAAKLNIYRELIPCSGDAVPKPDGHYHTIFSNSVLEHVRDIVPVLSEVYRLLASGGRFYMTVPSEKFDKYTIIHQMLSFIGLKSVAAQYREFYNQFWKHYHYYTLKEWETLAGKSGFEIVDSFTYNPKSLCLLNDLLVPFSLPGFIMKKVINRWTLFPRIRRFCLYPLYLWLRKKLKEGDRSSNGGLVFMALTK